MYVHTYMCTILLSYRTLQGCGQRLLHFVFSLSPHIQSTVFIGWGTNIFLMNWLCITYTPPLCTFFNVTQYSSASVFDRPKEGESVPTLPTITNSTVRVSERL